MGAFENQIRENETFESLMELYRESMRSEGDLRTRLAALEAEAIHQAKEVAAARTVCAIYFDMLEEQGLDPELIRTLRDERTFLPTPTEEP